MGGRGEFCPVGLSAHWIDLLHAWRSSSSVGELNPTASRIRQEDNISIAICTLILGQTVQTLSTHFTDLMKGLWRNWGMH